MSALYLFWFLRLFAVESYRATKNWQDYLSILSFISSILYPSFHYRHDQKFNVIRCLYAVVSYEPMPTAPIEANHNSKADCYVSYNRNWSVRYGLANGEFINLIMKQDFSRAIHI